MWISNKIATDDRLKRRKSSSGDVTMVDDGKVIVQNSNEYRNISVVSPRGINYVPVQGDRAVIIPVGEENICIGIIENNKDLEAGELMFSSLGGAKIILKNNGEVIINGTTIPALGG